jgi:protein-S-isoprenylcysteine O-methyltransferase Ste14
VGPIGGPTESISRLNLVVLLAAGGLDWLAVAWASRKADVPSATLDRGSLPLLRVAQVGSGAIALIGSALAPDLRLADHVWLTSTTGLVLVAVGTSLRVWAILALGGRFRRKVAIEKDHEVVRIGPYSLIRHPAYAGIILVFLGLAISLNNLCGFALPLLSLPAYLWRIEAEEKALASVLGNLYQTYREKTWKLIPGLW